MTKTKLDLLVILPPNAGEADPCAARLLNAMLREPGVSEAHLDRPATGPARLCVHYDPSLLAVASIEATARRAGAALAAQFGHVNREVSGLRHERHARLFEAALLRVPGVLHATVAFGMRRVAVEYDPAKSDEASIVRAIKDAGLVIVEPKKAHSVRAHAEATHEHGGFFGERSELYFSMMAGTFTGAGWLSTKLLGVPTWLPQLMLAAAYLCGGWFTVKEVAVAVRARKLQIDLLMLVAAAGAAAIGQWLEGALLLFLFSLGHALEGFAMSRARNAIAALAELVPETALRLDPDRGEQEVPLEALAVADRVLVKPNTRIPTDGVVVSGVSSVNQAPITGESVPVDKRPLPDPSQPHGDGSKVAPEHRVFAGTINGAGALEVVVTRPASESTLARVIELVTQAEGQKSPTQQFTDRFERVFVPAILALAVLLGFSWIVVDEPVVASFYRSMAVLVAASPCALAIATPSAVLSAVARAARGGVLVKGGAHIESLGMVRAIAFDKTGTLTEGKPRLTDLAPAPGVSEERLLAVAHAAEKQSDHPLALAIVQGAASRGKSGDLKATDVEAIIGFGLRARVGDEDVLIGKPGLFSRDGSSLPSSIAQTVGALEAAGRTVMVVKAGGAFLGALGVMDTPRQSAKRVIAELKRCGIARTIMLTGDNQRVADAVGQAVGISEARGGLLPADKVAAITELARSSDKVAMVGDGVNDAPALANATVGIAMGASGSDVALETADIALMADDLSALPFAVALSRACRAIIRQNLYASLGMVAFLVPATISGFAGIGVAVGLHEGSTLLVVGNALRLLVFRDPRSSEQRHHR